MNSSQKKYVALLRGINVGGNHKVPMADLRRVFEELGFKDVSTYINSGNVVFESDTAPDEHALARRLEERFGFAISCLVMSGERIIQIAEAIPDSWTNDRDSQKSDVLYLFEESDTPNIIHMLAPRPEFETITYVPGAVLSNIPRAYQPKSCLLRLIGTPLYRQVTIRNVLTARKLAELVRT